jgi:hypothetical protein
MCSLFFFEKNSAVFGGEIWPAAEYGRTMYTIRQRIGPLLMKMEKRYGAILVLEIYSFSRYYCVPYENLA